MTREELAGQCLAAMLRAGANPMGITVFDYDSDLPLDLRPGSIRPMRVKPLAEVAADQADQLIAALGVKS